MLDIPGFKIIELIKETYPGKFGMNQKLTINGIKEVLK